MNNSMLNNQPEQNEAKQLESIKMFLLMENNSEEQHWSNNTTPPILVSLALRNSGVVIFSRAIYYLQHLSIGLMVMLMIVITYFLYNEQKRLMIGQDNQRSGKLKNKFNSYDLIYHQKQQRMKMTSVNTITSPLITNSTITMNQETMYNENETKSSSIMINMKATNNDINKINSIDKMSKHQQNGRNNKLIN